MRQVGLAGSRLPAADIGSAAGARTHASHPGQPFGVEYADAAEGVVEVRLHGVK